MFKNLVFLGAPGAGKGTLAAIASKELNLPHISTGDIFRSNIKNKTPLGQKVEAVLASGALVSDELTNELVQDRLNQPDVKNGFILDGYPRTIAQAEALKTMVKLDAVINFNIADDLIISRLSGRRVCGNCGAVYNVNTMKPKKENCCDLCEGTLLQRPDDREEAIAKRLALYLKDTAPLVDFYAEAGLLKNLEVSNQLEETLLNFKKLAS